MNNNYAVTALLLLECLFTTISTTAHYLPVQFYYPKMMYIEPRIPKNWLTSFDAALSQGMATQGLNNESKQVSIIDLYDLQNSPKSAQGKLKFSQITVCATQNFTNGFFMTGVAPIRRLAISSLNDSAKQTTKQIACGDCLGLIGHTSCFFNDPYSDFIDMSFQGGILIPTSPTRNLHNALSLPIGFDGHWAFILVYDSAIGLYDWLTIGLHADLLIFTPHTKLTSEKKLITYSKRPQCSLSLFLKADHVSRGFSFAGSYSFTYQGATHSKIANNDNRLSRWFAHAIHGALEYDFTCRNDRVGTRIGLFYDKTISGKNVFLTNLWSGTLGIDISWQF